MKFLNKHYSQLSETSETGKINPGEKGYQKNMAAFARK